MGGAHSPPRRGGVARSAGVVSSAKRCAGLTTPAAPLRSLRGILLMAQPPLLCEEGNGLHPYVTVITKPGGGAMSRRLKQAVLVFVVVFAAAQRVRHGRGNPATEPSHTD